MFPKTAAAFPLREKSPLRALLIPAREALIQDPRAPVLQERTAARYTFRLPELPNWTGPYLPETRIRQETAQAFTRAAESRSGTAPSAETRLSAATAELFISPARPYSPRPAAALTGTRPYLAEQSMHSRTPRILSSVIAYLPATRRTEKLRRSI